MIPEQLRPYRFIKLGNWNEYKNNQKEIKIFTPKTNEELKRLIDKGWKPQAKQPQETGWTTGKDYSFDEMNSWLFENKSNYGVMQGILRVLDDDTADKVLIKIFLENFAETFRVRDHLYFEFTNQYSKKIIFYDKSGKHCGELQGGGQQCVCAGSIHPLGEVYDIRTDKPLIQVDYDKFCEVFKDYIPTQRKVVREFKKTSWSGDDIKDIPITSIISLSGMNDVGNGCYQGAHPVHGSKGGMNFRVDTLNNTWFCFRCWTGGSSPELIGVVENIIDCSSAGSNCFTSEQGRQVIEIARDKYGLKKPEVQETFKPQGWALSINIKTMANRQNWFVCPKCKTYFQFNELMGWFKCSCSKGGIKKFAELNLGIIKNESNY